MNSNNNQWKEETLDTFCQFIGGGTPDTRKEEYWEGDCPWLSSSDLELDDYNNIRITRFITEEAIANSATKRCPKGAILLVTRVCVGKIALAPEELCTSQDFTNVVQEKYNNKFILYALYMKIQHLINQTQGTAIKGITAKEIKKLTLSIPSGEEQEKIVRILTAADRELSLLQADLDQERQKKKALMQLLLSGLVRVNVEGGGADGAV